jgi:hypothetical protein
MMLLISMTQAFASQRIFGCAERDMMIREAGVSSVAHTCCAFFGRDLASIAEMLIAATALTFTFWPLSSSFVSGSDLFAIGFSLIYAVWGYGHIMAIVFNRQVAMITAVIVSFITFLCCGLKPDANLLMESFNGYGRFFLLLSPIRWSMSHWLYRHVTGKGSTFMQHEVLDRVKGLFNGRGYNIEKLACPNLEVRIIDRWHDRQGLVCHSGQLFLLGFLFRFLALFCLVMLSSSKVSGGELPIGASTSTRSRLVRDALIIFVGFFVVLQVLLLGQTY